MCLAPSRRERYRFESSGLAGRKQYQILEITNYRLDSLQTAIDLMKKDCYMATLDWKDADYCLPVAQCDSTCLAFRWKDQIYQYTCLPNGSASAPRTFTKILKVLYSELRSQGPVSTAYIDDFLLIANSLPEIQESIPDTCHNFNQS